MPLVQVSMTDGRTPEQKRALLDGITKVVQDALGASLDSIRVWIVEFPATDYMASCSPTSGRATRSADLSPPAAT